MAPPNKAMPHDNGLPYWQQMGAAIGATETVDATAGLLSGALRSESGSLFSSLNQQHRGVQQLAPAPAQLGGQRLFSNAYQGAMTHGMSGHNVSLQGMQARAGQGIDKNVLDDIYRLLGNVVLPQPQAHEPVAANQGTGRLMPMSEAPQPLPFEYLPGNGLQGAMDPASVLASVAKRVNEEHNALQHQLSQQQQQLQHEQLQARVGRTLHHHHQQQQSSALQWNPNGFGAGGNNVSSSQQQLLEALANQDNQWNSNPMGQMDVYGNNGNGGVMVHREVAKRPKQPLRALSAYNFFFRDERDRIVGETEGQYETTATKKQQLLAGHWYRDRTKKRRHRKTHGKIAFTELSKVISQRWKELSEELKAFYREVAAEDLMRYHRELDDQKSLHGAKDFLKRGPAK